ncbi:hypothetical protein B5F07_12100 [Lachnoclostridium sp. An169]|uniref:CPBP family intramembrane glutamic endopeptidase n=1 Tax=Lachnoclostridium sp. An169 TaxID=1965569 RepID=UPI000B36EE55|nr:CPBP family intramembrane glutamic endopeptidase [Lachnoclostridium sp. An169]OUP82909.1 hypothetical protein B5F07_12100 [Lachnoclostridium sp. An169]
MKTENQKQITTARAVGGCILSFFALIAAQLLALLAGQAAGNAVSTVLGTTAGTAAESVAGTITGSIISSVISAILYVAAALIFINLISKKILKTSLSGCRITFPVSVRPIWAVSSAVMPLLVILMVTQTSGRWIITDMNMGELIYTVADAVLFYGIAVGIVEEITFRGIIMTALEKRWNKVAAVLVPSVIFALSHVIGAYLDLPSILQLLIAGSLTGILFSLVTLESRSIWNSALMHAVWNILLVGGIFYIGTEKNDLYIFNYVLTSRDFLVTGGDFGVEASAFAVAGYGIFILAAVLMMRGRRKAEDDDPEEKSEAKQIV